MSMELILFCRNRCFVWHFRLDSKFVMKFIFKAAKDYPNECEATRKDIDRRLSAALKEWIQE